MLLLYEQDEMSGTVAAHLEEASENTVIPSFSSKSRCTVAEPIQQQGQEQHDDSSSLNLLCDEVFDEETLAGGSPGGVREDNNCQLLPTSKNQRSSNTTNFLIGNDQTAGCCSYDVLSQFDKMKREWRSYGWYKSYEEMDEVRKQEKVSKRKSVAYGQGTKVFYRCNNWRRTRCNFRMYAMIFEPDRMCLFASGEHDHTAKDPHYVTRTTMNVEGTVETPVPATSQQDVLTQFVMNATANMSHSYEKDQSCTVSKKNGNLSNSCAVPVQLIQNPYQLVDENRIMEMLQLATEINHTFTFTATNGEFCFEPNDLAFKGRSVVLVDAGLVVVVIERYDGIDQSCEIWLKSNWNQFLWAVRGKCMRVIYDLSPAGHL